VSPAPRVPAARLGAGERVALEYADTIAARTMIIARENASSRFDRAFRIPPFGFWRS